MDEAACRVRFAKYQGVGCWQILRADGFAKIANIGSVYEICESDIGCQTLCRFCSAHPPPPRPGREREAGGQHMTQYLGRQHSRHACLDLEATRTWSARKTATPFTGMGALYTPLHGSASAYGTSVVWSSRVLTEPQYCY